MTIVYQGIEFDVEFDYEPEEKMIMYYPDGSGYPGCPESLEITSIKHQGTEFYKLLGCSLTDIENTIREIWKINNE